MPRSHHNQHCIAVWYPKIGLKKYFILHIELSQQTFPDRRLGMRTITPVTLKMLQVRANRVCTRISFFVSKTVREIRAFFLPMTNILLKRVNYNLGRWTVDAPSTGRFREASSGPEKSFARHSLVQKKKRQTWWIVESFFKAAKNVQKPNTTDLERNLQQPTLRRSTTHRRRRA